MAQPYEVVHVLGKGDNVAMEVLWKGTLAVPQGTLHAGGAMRAVRGAPARWRGQNRAPAQL
jgi:hypothetical protein